MNRKHLPADTAEWTPIFQRILGSPDPYGRQLNGLGGGISSLSKIVVVGSPTCKKDGITVDVEYTFVQVGVQDGKLDFSGNCGNLTTAVGVFALDESICKVPSIAMYAPEDAKCPTGKTQRGDRSQAGIKLLNTNTGKIIRASFPISPKTGLAVLIDEEISITQVPGKASRITLEFMNPAGAKTGKLLPTGQVVDTIVIDGVSIAISCVDVSNPSVFVRLSDVDVLLRSNSLEPIARDGNLNAFLEVPVTDQARLDILEQIRMRAATLMGLDPYIQAQPKLSVLNSSASPMSTGGLAARTLSMGVFHKAIPTTLALCLGAAAGLNGSVPNKILASGDDGGVTLSSTQHSLTEAKAEGSPFITRNGSQKLEIKIPGGTVAVIATFSEGEIKSVGVERTARRLMRGEVYW